MKRYSLSWWCHSVVHNCLVHPFLPLADLLDRVGLRKAAQVVYDAHDTTVPPEEEG